MLNLTRANSRPYYAPTRDVSQLDGLIAESQGKVFPIDTSADGVIKDLSVESPDNIEITAENAGEIAAGGRVRWMIENECFNTLKHHQFHMGHNYGYGKKYLIFNFYSMLLLAFLCQQIGLNADKLIRRAHKNSVSQSDFWTNVRSLLEFVLIDSWEYLMAVISGFITFKAEPYFGP